MIQKDMFARTTSSNIRPDKKHEGDPEVAFA